MSQRPYTVRLAESREIVSAARAGEPTPPAVGLTDQIRAAARDALKLFREIQRPPGGDVDRDAVSPERSDEITARAMAAIEGCRPCTHLKDASPRKALARLPLYVIECIPCVQALIDATPPADEVDRCDWCGDRGIETLTPVAGQYGMVVVMGDACPSCAPHLTATTARSPKS